MSPVATAVAVSLTLTLVSAPLILLILRRGQVIDLPTARSSHSHGVVRGLGIAQAFAVVVTYGVLGPVPAPAWIAAIGFSLLGFVDDVKRLGVTLRLLVQLAVAFAAVAASAVFSWPWSLAAALSVLGATVLLAGFVNATNFMDGINGISIAHGVLWGVVYLIIVQGLDLGGWAIVSATVFGTSVAIFPWNWGRRAKAFLGDSGAYLLGSSVGLIALLVFLATRDPLIAFGPLAIYLADTGATLSRRAWRRQPLLQAHKEHIFQRLSQYSSHQAATSIVVIFSALVSFVAIAAQRSWIQLAVAYVFTVMLVSAYFLSPKVLQRTSRST